ncbi:hypothetical protein PLICRDRAFT_122615 [Plicaturopsis crispa FD-325 SS-3]|nr:hypothetical protein PLICRDRAFT_122615 [Plicaturopsis crispa FD-325 SS-3]
MDKSFASLPSSLNLVNSPSQLSTSTSLTAPGSIQSRPHLSRLSTNSHRRTTTQDHNDAAGGTPSSKRSNLTGLGIGNQRSVLTKLSSLLVSLFPGLSSQRTGSHAVDRSYLRTWPKPWMKWTAIIYCLFCTVFFSNVLVKHARGESSARTTPTTLLESSPLGDLSQRQRFSRISTVFPDDDFQPYIIHPRQVINEGISACLWAPAQDLGLVAPWAARWPGQISLVVTTPSPPMSKAYEDTVARISTLQNHSVLAASLSAHILHLKGHSPDSPNAYLNLARLFAQTDQVVLFPSNLSVLPPYHVLALVQNAPNGQPVIVATDTSTPSPLALPQAHPSWCTERFFYTGSRKANWAQCLWQLSLEALAPISSVKSDGRVAPAPASRTAVSGKLARRLMGKYRAEACALAASRLEYSSGATKEDGKKMKWLAQFCRKTVDTV